MVSEKYVGAGDPEFAFLAGGHFVAVWRHEFAGLIGEGGAVGAEDLVPFSLEEGFQVSK